LAQAILAQAILAQAIYVLERRLQGPDQ